jgi:hypothetical protein
MNKTSKHLDVIKNSSSAQYYSLHAEVRRSIQLCIATVANYKNQNWTRIFTHYKASEKILQYASNKL